MLRKLLIGFAAMASIAQADVRIRDETNAVSMPYATWELRFPGKGWILEQQKKASDGGQYYYMFSNPQRRLVASFYLEPAYKCDTGEACRTTFWAKPGPGYSNPGNEHFFNTGPFSVVEFTTQTGEIIRKHWSAHAVHEGVWIDMHLSSVDPETKDFQSFKTFGEELVITQKSACPECFSSKGLLRQDSLILFGKSRSGDKDALDQLQRHANSGDPEAQFMLARLYSWGSPLLQRDERQSVSLTQEAADQGHAEAQANLGYFYFSGRGVDSKNTQLAVEWWTRAADQGFAPAQFNLANLYATDEGLKDDVKAFEWTRKAAERGMAPAQLNLGLAYLRGAGTQKSLRDALDWYRKAAMQGNETAMVNMATLFADAGSVDPKFYEASIAILSEPLLMGNKRAQEIKAKLCAESPSSCSRAPSG